MNNKDLNKQFEALKRQATDLARDLHARKLLVPAIAIFAAIIAALVLLPKGSTPPPAPTTTAVAPATKAKIEVAAQISTIKPTPLGDNVPLTKTNDPFTGETGYNCEVYQKDPKILKCDVSDLTLFVLCTDDTGPCGTTGASGGTGATGGSGSGTSDGSGTGTGTGGGSTGGTGDGSGSGSGGIRYFYYAATIKLDSTTYKKVRGGTMLPKSASPLVAFLGQNSDGNSGSFLAADGVTVSGVSIDPVFHSFSLDIGQTVTLTDADGENHKLTLKSISLVEEK